MMGISQAMVTGHLIAADLLGRTPLIDPTPFLPDRFN
jgi:glycine/D-amino acid oxidase-like deaminating enzyme